MSCFGSWHCDRSGITSIHGGRTEPVRRGAGPGDPPRRIEGEQLEAEVVTPQGSLTLHTRREMSGLVLRDQPGGRPGPALEPLRPLGRGRISRQQKVAAGNIRADLHRAGGRKTMLGDQLQGPRGRETGRALGNVHGETRPELHQCGAEPPQRGAIAEGGLESPTQYRDGWGILGHSQASPVLPEHLAVGGQRLGGDHTRDILPEHVPVGPFADLLPQAAIEDECAQRRIPLFAIIGEEPVDSVSDGLGVGAGAVVATLGTWSTAAS